MNKAHEVHAQIQKASKIGNAINIHVAEHLYNFHKDKMWGDLDYQSFEAYCADPDIAFSYQKALKLIRIYEVFCLENNIPLEELADYPYTKLHLVTRHVINVENWLADVAVLSFSDLEKKLEDNADKLKLIGNIKKYVAKLIEVHELDNDEKMAAIAFMEVFDAE